MYSPISLMYQCEKILKETITNLIQQLKRIYDPKFYLKSMQITLKLNSPLGIFMYIVEKRI